MDPYQPEQWHDFFLATAGAAAGLTGLLFVALSLHIRYIATEPRYRDIARGSLIGLVTALVLSLLVLVRQPVTWLGPELGLVGLAYLVLVGGQQLLTLRARSWSIPRGSLVRSLIAYFMAFAGSVSSAGMSIAVGPGLYLSAVIVVAIVLWSLWNAWLLVIGVADEEIEAETKLQ